MFDFINFCLSIAVNVLGRLIGDWLEGVLHDADNDQ